MFFVTVHQALEPAVDQAKDFLQRGGHRPSAFAPQNFRSFFGAVPAVAKLIAEAPEILFFAVVQWLVISLACLVWPKMLQWILLGGVQKAMAQASRASGMSVSWLDNTLLLGWSFFIVCAASYAIGMCNAATVAVTDLRRCGERVTLGRCLAIAGRHTIRIWLFTVADSWITVDAIVDRLLRRDDNRTAKELRYYAWKVATMAVVPALVNGRNLVAAGEDSISLLTAQPLRTLGLRLGYSAVCWVVGALTFGAAIAFAHFGALSSLGTISAALAKSGTVLEVPHVIDNIYFLAAASLLAAVGVVSILVRPFFLLSVANLYAEHVDVKPEIEGDIADWDKAAPQWRAAWLLLAVTVLMIVAYFADDLGIAPWIRRVAAGDLFAHLPHQR